MKLKYDNQLHAYWLDGKRCKSVTKIAEIPDDKYGLDQWRKRMVAIGMARDPSLAERVSAHHDDKAELNKIAEEALAAARAHEAADRGTTMHRIIERHVRGEELILTPFAESVIGAWERILQSAGLEAIPEYAERIVVHDKARICGKFDNLFKRRSDHKIVLADLKTGSVDYPHAIAIQLGMYANAPHVAERLPAEGGTTETFERLPENLDLKYGLIVHMPDPDKVELHKVDIAAGWEAARQICLPALKWRGRRDLTKAYLSVPVIDPDTPASTERVDWLRGRLQLLGMVDGARTLVATRWPVGVTPKGPWTDADIDLLDTMLKTVERDVQESFPERDPALGAVTPI